MDIYKYSIYKLIIIIISAILIITIVLYRFKINTFNYIDNKTKNIILGQTTDLTNIVSINYSIGFQIAFNYINKNGGINNYNIKIILLNDNYEILKSVKNAKLLVEYYNVLGIIGTYGTPTNTAMIKEVIKDKIPLIGPLTGAGSLRVNFKKNIIFTNSAGVNEIELMVNSLLVNKYTNISMIYQNDSFGINYYDAITQHILKNNLNINIISTGTYERNNNNFEKALASIFNLKTPFNYKQKISINIEAIILICTVNEMAGYIGFIRKIKPSIAIYYSYWGGPEKENLKLVKNKNNIYQTVLFHNNLNDFPIFTNLLLKEIDNWNKINSINKIDKKNIVPTLVQGFFTGLMISKVLKNFKNSTEITSETFIDMFYKMKTIDVYGIKAGPFILNKNNTAINYSNIVKFKN